VVQKKKVQTEQGRARDTSRTGDESKVTVDAVLASNANTEPSWVGYGGFPEEILSALL